MMEALEMFAKVIGEILLNFDRSAKTKAWLQWERAAPFMMPSLESGVEKPDLVLIPLVPKNPLVKL